MGETPREQLPISSGRSGLISTRILSRWLGHSSIQTTLIYLELVPDPTGSLATVP